VALRCSERDGRRWRSQTDIGRAKVLLFEGIRATNIVHPDATPKRVGPDDVGRIFPHQHEPVGEWMIEVAGEAVATGGAPHHYNPPYGDTYMDMLPSASKN